MPNKGRQFGYLELRPTAEEDFTMEFRRHHVTSPYGRLSPRSGEAHYAARSYSVATK